MRFRYIGDDARIFPHVSLAVQPGDVVDVESNPDPRYFDDAEPFGTPVEATHKEEDDA